ncbi:MAG: hypothetical protein ABL961_10500 [Vicinamibacterales bacterium]
MSALLGLTSALPLHAQDRATLTLTNGQAAYTALLEINAAGIVTRADTDERNRTYALSEIRSVEFVGGLLPEAQARMAAGRPFIVLRGRETADGSREVVEGQLLDLENHEFTVATARGTRRLSALSIAQIWINPGPEAPPASTAAQPPAGATPRGQISIPANQAWTNTGIVLRRGWKIQVHAGGDILLAQGLSSGIGGSPAATVAGAKYPVRGAFAGALIGRVGGGSPFLIGPSSGPIDIRDTGPLFLGVNDDILADNSGSYTATVEAVR